MKLIKTSTELRESINESWKQMNKVLDDMYMDSVKDVKWMHKS
jgi:hypothetical protein